MGDLSDTQFLYYRRGKQKTKPRDNTDDSEDHPGSLAGLTGRFSRVGGQSKERSKSKISDIGLGTAASPLSPPMDIGRWRSPAGARGRRVEREPMRGDFRFGFVLLEFIFVRVEFKFV